MAEELQGAFSWRATLALHSCSSYTGSMRPSFRGSKPWVRLSSRLAQGPMWEQGTHMAGDRSPCAGQGTFAVVDLCVFTPRDGGPKTKVAVKRFRPQVRAPSMSHAFASMHPPEHAYLPSHIHTRAHAHTHTHTHTSRRTHAACIHWIFHAGAEERQSEAGLHGDRGHEPA
jgi:hypothetical protein